jgi:hypothetical protein
MQTESESHCWFSATTGVDNALNGQPTQVPNLVGNPYPTNQAVNNWLNTSSFQSPATGTVGNLGLVSLRGPGFFDWDMALSRTFAFKAERQTFQVRAHFFNIANHPNFNYSNRDH